MLMRNSTVSLFTIALGAPPRDSSLLLGSTVFIPSFLAFVILYHLLAPMYSTPKQLSWIITTTASAVMTLASVPFVLDFLADGGSVKNIRASPVYAYTVNRVFQAYLIADLIVGAAHYRSQLSLLTGWIHHLLYVLIVQVAIKRSWTQIFCVCASMELPTFILALGSIHPDLRCDRLFALSFFTTRILLHIILCISYLLPTNRPYIAGASPIPGVLLLCIFPLHAFWFTGCVKGFVKRKQKRDRTKCEPGPTVIALDIPQESLHVGASRPCPPSPTTLQARRTSSSHCQNIATLRLNVLEKQGSVVNFIVWDGKTF